MKLKRDEQFQKVVDNHKSIQQDFKEQIKYLSQKGGHESKLKDEVRDALREDIDQKKEISLLKKKDQMENFERGKNFHHLYKQKLVERLLEKKERADRVKEQ